MDKQSSFLTREEEFCFSFAFEAWVTLLGLIKIVGHKIYVYISSGLALLMQNGFIRLLTPQLHIHSKVP